MPKKNGNYYEDMDGMMPMKKLSGKKKDKNWKNHLLDANEDEAIDLSSLGDFNGFDESIEEDDEDETGNR